MHPNGSAIYNSQDTEAIQMPISIWMDLEDVAYMQ